MNAGSSRCAVAASVVIELADPKSRLLSYTNRRNRSPALERRRQLVRRAARQYLLLILAAAVIVSLLGILVASYTR